MIEHIRGITAKYETSIDIEAWVKWWAWPVIVFFVYVLRREPPHGCIGFRVVKAKPKIPIAA